MLYYCMCCVLFSCLSFIGYGINFLYFNLALIKRYTIVCVACSLVVYGLSFIGCGINFLVEYHILVCAECCLLTVALHC